MKFLTVMGGGLFSAIILMVLSAIFSGYALSVLWSWFIVPTFGLPAISIPVAIGISIIVGYMSRSVTEKDEDESFGDIMTKGIITAITKPAMALLIGYVVHLFM